MTAAQDRLSAYERGVLAGAVAYTAFLQRGPHIRIREEADTLERAKEIGASMAAAHKKAALIYAINPQGRAVMAGSVGVDGSFHPVVIEDPA